MYTTLNIFSFNAQGLRDKYKRKAVFSWLREKGPGIYLLQKCHSFDASEKQWEVGEYIFSHGTSNSEGVAILISPQLDI